MMRTLVLAAAMSLCNLPAIADTESNALASCMVANATDTQTSNMKQFMIHALQENKAEATDSLLKLSFEALSIATQKCGLSFADVQTPKFEQAMEIYGEALGEKIMKDAFAYLEIPID